MHRTRCMRTWGGTQEGVCHMKLVLFTLRHQNRSGTLKAPQSKKLLQSVSMWLTKVTWLIFFGDTAMLYTNNVFIKTTEVKLRWRRTAEIIAQVIKGEFISIISLLRIVGIRRSLVSSTVTHRQCLPNSSLNQCKGHFLTSQGSHYGMGARRHPARLCSTPKEEAHWKSCLWRQKRNQSKGNLRPNRNWEMNWKCRSIMMTISAY